MKLKIGLGLLAWLLLGLALLLTGCASNSPPHPVQGPAIPPLPTEAKQQFSPTFSAGAQSDIQSWQRSLTVPSSPAAPASGPIAR